MIKNGAIINCKVCNAERYVSQYYIKIGKGKYCSTTCYIKDKKGRPNLKLRGIRRSEEYKRKLSILKKGKPNLKLQRGAYRDCNICGRKKYIARKDLLAYKHFYCSNNCRYTAMKGVVTWNKGKTYKAPNISKALMGRKLSLEVRQEMSRSRKGRFAKEKNPNWKGGITAINSIIRHSFEYKQWRLAIFRRDRFTCCACGSRNVGLNADHIKPFALYPELRFSLDNGRTLCVPCHRKTETYGGKKIYA